MRCGIAPQSPNRGMGKRSVTHQTTSPEVVLAAFGVDLGQQPRLLLRAPHTPSHRRHKDLCLGQNRLLLESRRRPQRSAKSPNAASTATRRRSNAYASTSGRHRTTFTPRQALTPAPCSCATYVPARAPRLTSRSCRSVMSRSKRSWSEYENNLPA